jgi:TfoX/Sxy family transcriptional regulator of competence genes
MAYDEGLADRIRDTLAGEPGIGEKEMFGGIAFLHADRMFVGIVKDALMVRVGPDRHDASIRERHVRPMDFTGRPMKGYVYVSAAGYESDAELEKWVRRGLEHVQTLPAKPPKKKKPRKSRK